MDDVKTQAKAKLADVVRRVMADGKIDPSERDVLAALKLPRELVPSDFRALLDP